MGEDKVGREGGREGGRHIYHQPSSTGPQPRDPLSQFRRPAVGKGEAYHHHSASKLVRKVYPFAHLPSDDGEEDRARARAARRSVAPKRLVNTAASSSTAAAAAAVATAVVTAAATAATVDTATAIFAVRCSGFAKYRLLPTKSFEHRPSISDLALGPV